MDWNAAQFVKSWLDGAHGLATDQRVWQKSTNASSENKSTTADSTGVLCVVFVFVNCHTHIFHASKFYHKLMYIHIGPFGSQKVSHSTFTSASLPVIMILRTTKIYLGVKGGSNIHKKIDSFFCKTLFNVWKDYKNVG